MEAGFVFLRSILCRDIISASSEPGWPNTRLVMKPFTPILQLHAVDNYIYKTRTLDNVKRILFLLPPANEVAGR